MTKHLFTVLSCIATISAQANAVIDTLPASNNTANGWRGMAQTFQTPAGNNLLVSWQFSLAARAANGNISFSIVPWSGNAPSGAALYSTSIPWGTNSSTPVISDINLSLTSGQLYGAVTDFIAYSQASVRYGTDSYGGGGSFWFGSFTGWQSYPEFDQTFRAEFTVVPEPSALALLLLPFGMQIVRRACLLAQHIVVRPPGTSGNAATLR